MTIRTEKAAILVATGNRPAPVQVKLRRLNANQAQPYPPDGETGVWWDRLKNALGTSSGAFVNASLRQLQAAAQLPYGGISETALNAALAMIEAVAPKDEIEAALAIQMAATHAASMSVLSWFGNGGGADRRLTALASAAARLLQAYATQVETFGAYATAAHSSSASSTSISMKEHRRLSATSTKRTIDDT